MTSNGQQTYYEILEIAPGAAPHEIHAAFQRAKETYSPDSPALYSVFTPEEAQELIRMVEEAFRVLSTPTLRKAYDAQKATPTSAAAGDNSTVIPEADALDAAMDVASGVMGMAPAAVRTVDELPKGYAKTLFGSYKMNEELEEEIKNQTVCDGGFLQKVREYKKISLQQLSENTRISVTFLKAIESNTYSDLPATVFVRGFIIQVVRALGLAQERVVSSYIKLVKDSRGK